MLPIILEMLLAALLPIRDACPLYYPQKSAEPAPTKRLRAFLGAEAALDAGYRTGRRLIHARAADRDQLACNQRAARCELADAGGPVACLWS